MNTSRCVGLALAASVGLTWLCGVRSPSLAFAQDAKRVAQSGDDAILEVERTAQQTMLERLTAPQPLVRPTLPSREEQLFGEVLRVIENEYYDASVTRAQLLEAAVQGMLDYLNSRNIRRLGTPGGNALLSPNEYSRIRQNLSGQISGIGVVARKEATSGAFEIVRVLENSPGMRAGLTPGDRIVAIDGLEVKTVGRDGAIRLLRGDPGTSVRLAVLGDKTVQPKNVDVIRGEFRVAQVSSARLDACTGYLRVPNFGPGVSEAAEQALIDLVADGYDSLVIDLRDNPGGALEEAVSVAGLLLEKDSPVVRLQTREDTDQMARTTGTPIFKGPVAVLVDNRTGGAAEVLAAALQANRRGTVVGSRTSGRATAESIYALSTGAAIRLSTAVYRDPAGGSWAGSGLNPLVSVDPQPFEPGDLQDPTLSTAQALMQSLVTRACGVETR